MLYEKISSLGRPDFVVNPIEQKLQSAVGVHEAGDVRKAEDLYRQVLATHPRYAAAWEQLGLAQFDQSSTTRLNVINTFSQLIHIMRVPSTTSAMSMFALAGGRNRWNAMTAR